MRGFETSIPNAYIRYLEFGGTGTPLLMIHGLGCASSFEYPHVVTADALRGRHSILVDLLGFGFSDRPDDFEYGVKDHAFEIARFVERLGLEKVDLYGHSMGGAIAIEAADLLEGRVRNLILSEANLDSGGGAFSRPIAASDEATYVAEGHARSCKAAKASGDIGWAATMRAASARAVYRSAKSLVEGSTPTWRSRLLRRQNRASFIFGENSLPDPDSEHLASHGVRILVVPGAGHSMSLENPAGLARAIAEASS